MQIVVHKFKFSRYDLKCDRSQYATDNISKISFTRYYKVQLSKLATDRAMTTNDICITRHEVRNVSVALPLAERRKMPITHIMAQNIESSTLLAIKTRVFVLFEQKLSISKTNHFQRLLHY